MNCPNRFILCRRNWLHLLVHRRSGSKYALSVQLYNEVQLTAGSLVFLQLSQGFWGS